MKLSFNKMIFVITSFASLFSNKAVFAAGGGAFSRPSAPNETNLADQMIENQIFKMNPLTQTIEVDEIKLLQTLKNELSKKIQDQGTHLDEKIIYQNLMQRLQPGSFGRNNNGAPGVQSMDFSKGN